MTLFNFEDLHTEEVKVMTMTASAIEGVERVPVQLDVYVSNFWAGAFQNSPTGVKVGTPSAPAWAPTLFLAMPLSKFDDGVQAHIRCVYTVKGHVLETTRDVYDSTWYPTIGYRDLFDGLTTNEFTKDGFRYGTLILMGIDTAGKKYERFPYYNEDTDEWSWDTDKVYRIPNTEENVGLYDNPNGVVISIFGNERFVAENKFFHNFGVPYAEGLVVDNTPYYPEINAQGDGWETITGWRMQTGVLDLSQPELNWFNLLRAITGQNGGATSYTPSDIFMNWVVYLDGDKKPIISINGGSSAIQFDGVIEPTESYVELRAVEWFGKLPTTNEEIETDLQLITRDYPVLKMPLNTSYETLMENVNYQVYQKLISGLFDYIVNGNRILLAMRVATYVGDVVEHFSDWCYVQVPAKLPENPDEVIRGKITANDASTITVVYGYAEESDDFYPDDIGTGTDSTDPSDSIDSADGYTAHSLLTTTYAMTPTRLQQIGRVLWSDGFMDNIQLVNNSPIENIVSVKMFPFSISGTDENIMLGNVSTGVNGAKVSNDYSYKKTIGSMSITKKYNSFLDYAPFTKLSIFLPFIGYKELDTDVYMGRTLKVEYITDLVTGACKAILYADNIPTDDFDGSMGIDIPITGSNRAQVESGYIMSAVGGGMQLASGNIGGAIGTVLNGAMSKYSSTTKGNASPSCGAYQTRNIFVVYNRPSWQDLGAFNHTHGRMCNQSKLLNGLQGFTKVADGVDLSTIPCTEEERTMIKEYLTRGFYL